MIETFAYLPGIWTAECMSAGSMPSTQICSRQERTQRSADLLITTGATRQQASWRSICALQPAGQWKGFTGNFQESSGAVMEGV